MVITMTVGFSCEYNFRTTWEVSLSEGLSRTGWPVDMPMRELVGLKTQLTVGRTIPLGRDPGLYVRREIKMNTKHAAFFCALTGNVIFPASSSSSFDFPTMGGHIFCELKQTPLP